MAFCYLRTCEQCRKEKSLPHFKLRSHSGRLVTMSKCRTCLGHIPAALPSAASHPQPKKKQRKKRVPRTNDGGKTLRCADCETYYPATTDNFHRNRSNKYGFCAYCKACETQRKRASKKHNREAANARYRKKYHSDKDFRQYAIDKSIQWQKDNPQNTANTNARRKSAISNDITKATWLHIMQSTNWTCKYCHCKLTNNNRTVDHVVPLSKGGEHSKDNLVPCCRSCNSRKNAKTPEEWERTKKYDAQLSNAH